MKLFLRDHIPLIFMYFTQLFLTMLIYWLDGHENVSISLYALLLSSFILFVYLLYRYMTNRSLYTQLEEPLQSIDGHISQTSPLSEGLHQLLKDQARHYKHELQQYKQRLDYHISFIHQWVHQMKTPISVIHLLIQDDDTEKSKEIGDEIDRLKKGLETVLYTARLDSFEHDFYVETLHLEKIVRSVTSKEKRLFIRKRIFPSFQFENNIKVVSDEKWLSFIITQLVTNAIRYTIQEGKKIHFHAFQNNTDTILEVRDEGVGIPLHDLPRVFDPYFTGENGRNFEESTGMGLYLVKQILDKLGHSIEVESDVSLGTTVRIKF
ncbi:HAMP domain-containing histidine kinase [Bacillus sp. BGMRC 2118]|nr:HAMP domain-containing histidine kinase [Bacillus sp. BGMRC 2118]